MARESEHECQEPSNGERERARGTEKELRDPVIVRESERDRGIARVSESDRVVARHSEKERERSSGGAA